MSISKVFPVEGRIGRLADLVASELFGRLCGLGRIGRLALLAWSQTLLAILETESRYCS